MTQPDIKSFDIKNIKVLIGLGNPGQAYCNHRHTVGFKFIDFCATQFNASGWASGPQLERTSIRLNNEQEIMLIKPQTFMNNSGSIISWLSKKGIKPENIIVAHDELEKPFGTVLLRFGGSHKGHNGLKSIMSQLGDGFWRLKFGIGRPTDKADVPSYVLTNFSVQEQQELPQLFEKGLQLLQCTT